MQIITGLILFLIASIETTPVPKLYRSRTDTFLARLHPRQDILITLTQLLAHRSHRAITVSAAVGSVLHCHIRFANQSYLTRVEGPLEITALTGTFDEGLNPHLHIAVADGRGGVVGGHLPSLEERQTEGGDKLGKDCPIFTTLELALSVHRDVVFNRRIDPETTYNELTIRPAYHGKHGILTEGEYGDSEAPL